MQSVVDMFDETPNDLLNGANSVLEPSDRSVDTPLFTTRGELVPESQQRLQCDLGQHMGRCPVAPDNHNAAGPMPSGNYVGNIFVGSSPSPTARPQPFLTFNQLPKQCAFSGAEDQASSSSTAPDYRQSIGCRYPLRGSNNPPMWRDLNRPGDFGPESAFTTTSDALLFANGISVQQHPSYASAGGPARKTKGTSMPLTNGQEASADHDVQSANQPSRDSRSGWRQCFDLLARLHRRLRRSELPKFCGDTSSLMEVISSRTGLEVGSRICKALHRHLDSEPSQIIAFRASVVYPFTLDDMYCVLLEWRERTGLEAIAIFDEDPENPEFLSYMIHYQSEPEVTTEYRQYGPSYILWNLREMSDIRTLLEATQHVLGVLDLPARDAMVLYSNKGGQDCSIEDTTRYAQLLFQHFVRIEQVASAVAPAMRFLEERTSVEVQHWYGERYYRYAGSVEL